MRGGCEGKWGAEALECMAVGGGRRWRYVSDPACPGIKMQYRGRPGVAGSGGRGLGCAR